MAAPLKFTTTDEVDDATFEAFVILADGSLFNIAAAIRDGNGSFTSDDENLSQALDKHPALVRATTPRTPKKKEQ